MKVIRIPPKTTRVDGQSTERVSRRQLLSLGAWFTLALCIVAAILPLLFGQPGVWTTLGLEGLFSWQTAIGGVLGFIAGMTVALLMTRWQPLYVIAEHIAGLVAWETFQGRDIIVISTMAALGEELLFRGALQPLIGLLPMAMLFGLLHATSLAHIVLASLLGLWLGWLYQWSGSLWPPITAHLVLDLLTGLMLARELRADALPDQGV